ncbi:hypothetical protein KAU92_02650, partial [Candidatus Bathyarchaeota archaeon]|nr:hypothetical protein [Candidatus Bathyarchaeota archaeon]
MFSFAKDSLFIILNAVLLMIVEAMEESVDESFFKRGCSRNSRRFSQKKEEFGRYSCRFG